ncbi:MAG: hypothetical protein H6739_06745 [Alphaproteobacteria bacterium]|nr:hypothetical protein [Alphaproteobacteria bacterium]
MTPMLSLLLPLLGACDKPEPEDTAPVCDATLTASMPADGEDIIGTNARILLDWEGTVTADGASLTVTPEHPYSAVVGDGTVIFRPDEPLQPETAYTWEAALCGEPVASGGFTTRTEGDAAEPGDVEGRSFGVDLAAATWVEPRNGGELFAQLFGGLLLLGVEGADDRTIDVIGAVGEDVDGQRQQDPCYETIDFPEVDFSRNPYLELGPAEFPVKVQGQDVVLHGLRLYGAFNGTGTALTDGALSAQGDLRDVVGQQYTAYCQQLQTFGLSCVTCEADGATACIDLYVTDIQGSVVPGLRVLSVSNPSAECGGGDTGRE